MFRLAPFGNGCFKKLKRQPKIFISTKILIFLFKNPYRPESSIVKAKTTRSPQCCVKCRNHGIESLKKDHKKYCEFDKKDHSYCTLCKTTQERRRIVARDQKLIRGIYKELPQPPKENPAERRDQNCRKCLNHGKMVLFNGHKDDCRFKNCNCERCTTAKNRCKGYNKELKFTRKQKSMSSMDVEANLKQNRPNTKPQFTLDHTDGPLDLDMYIKASSQQSCQVNEIQSATVNNQRTKLPNFTKAFGSKIPTSSENQVQSNTNSYLNAVKISSTSNLFESFNISITDQPGPANNHKIVLGPENRTSPENQFASNLNSTTEKDFTSVWLTSLNTLNLDQPKAITEDIIDSEDQSKLDCKALDLLKDMTIDDCPKPQKKNKIYEDLDNVEYENDIGSDIIEFTRDNVDDFMDRLCYSDEPITQLESLVIFDI